MHNIWLTLLAASVLAFTPNRTFAAVMTSVETDIAPPEMPGTAGAPYTPTFSAGGPSQTDLLHGQAPSGCGLSSAQHCYRISRFKDEFAKGLEVLTDGSVTTYYRFVDLFLEHSAYATAGQYSPFNNAGETVTYSLDEATDIGSIVIYGGWNDGGRDQQHYDLQVSTDHGLTFFTLGSIDVNPGVYLGPNADTTPVSTRVAFTDDSTHVLAAGVTDIRVNFLEVENGYSGYTEIDVFAAVPEPSSLALVGCTALLSFWKSRRN